MTHSWVSFGHKHVKNLLEKQLATKNLSHAYLFKGPSGVGKRTLALELAKQILAGENLSTHPDFQMLDASGEIVMEQALEFLERLHLKPFIGQKKVAVINHAQNLNTASSNALLKTLEEPSPSTIIILIAEGAVLPTIISRCQVFNFNAFTEDDLN